MKLSFFVAFFFSLGIGFSSRAELVEGGDSQASGVICNDGLTGRPPQIIRPYLLEIFVRNEGDADDAQALSELFDILRVQGPDLRQGLNENTENELADFLDRILYDVERRFSLPGAIDRSPRFRSQIVALFQKIKTTAVRRGLPWFPLKTIQDRMINCMNKFLAGSPEASEVAELISGDWGMRPYDKNGYLRNPMLNVRFHLLASLPRAIAAEDAQLSLLSRLVQAHDYDLDQWRRLAQFALSAYSEIASRQPDFRKNYLSQTQAFDFIRQLLADPIYPKLSVDERQALNDSILRFARTHFQIVVRPARPSLWPWRSPPVRTVDYLERTLAALTTDR